MGLAATLFNGVEPFEQIVNTPSIEVSMWNLVKIGRAVSEMKTFKDYTILNTYTAKGQGRITSGYKSLIVTKMFTTLIMLCKFQSLVFVHFQRMIFFSHFPDTKEWECKIYLAAERSRFILGSSFEQTWQILSPYCYIPRFSLKAFLVLDKKILKCFYHIWAGRPSCLMIQNRKLTITLRQKAPFEICWKWSICFREEDF